MVKGLFGGGNGAKEKPYIVEDVDDLLQIDVVSRTQQGAYYEQGNTINMSGRADFISIGDNGPSFNGHFDGMKYGIINFNIEGPEATGFFSSARNATLKNIIIKNAKVKHTNALYGNAAILCASLYGGRITDCYVSGEVHSQQYAALMFGRVDSYDARPVIKGCYAEGYAEGGSNTAGFCSILSEADVDDCGFRGKVFSALGPNTAGFASQISDSTIKKSDATAIINGFGGLGGFCSISSRTNFENCNSCFDIAAHAHTADSSGYPPSTAGGFRAQGYESYFLNCHSTGKLEAYGWGGGFTGMVSDDQFSGCSAFADVVVLKSEFDEYGGAWAGGFTPNSATSKFTDCAAFGTVKGSDLVSGFARFDEDSKTLLLRCYAFNQEVTARSMDWAQAGTFGYNSFQKFLGIDCMYNADMVYQKGNPPFAFNGTPTSDLSVGGFSQPSCKFRVLGMIMKSKTKCERIAINKLLGGY